MRLGRTPGGGAEAEERARHARLRELFVGARPLAPAERVAFLERGSAGDPALRADAEALLAEADRAASDGEEASGALARGALAEEAADLLGTCPPPPALVGTYRVEREVGRGGMGVVYLARDERLGRPVALKSLPAEVTRPGARARLEREAKVLASLAHPNIATIYHVEEAEGRPFLVLQYIPGESLRGRLARGPLPLAEALGVMVSVARAVEAAHRQGVVHRDLKPGNVQMTPEGEVFVLDFGLARLVAGDGGDGGTSPIEGTARDAQTRDSVVVGTPGYMSPEQSTGGSVGPETDVWAFGCVLFECLTGKRPWSPDRSTLPAPSAGGEAAAIAAEPDLRALPPETPERVRALLRRCLEREPAARLGDIAEARRELEAEIASLAGRSGAPRHRVLAAAAAVLLVATGLLAYALKRAADTGPRPRPPVEVGTLASLVVLPSRVHGLAEMGYLADVIPMTLSTRLGGIAGLDVKLPPSSEGVARVDGDVARIASLYGADACVVSTVEVAPGRLVLEAQLVEPRGRSVLWTREFEGRLEGYQELVHELADSLRETLRPGAPTLAPPVRGAASSRAELALRRGQHLALQALVRRDVSDLETALTSLRRAVEAEPSLAEAAAWMGGVHALLTFFRVEPERNLGLAGEWVEKAIALDPREGAAWSTLAYVEHWRAGTPPAGTNPRVLEYALRGASLKPGDPIVYPSLNLALPSADLRLAAVGEMARIDPLSPFAHWHVAGQLDRLGRREEAVAACDRAIDLDRRYGAAHEYRARNLALLGRADEAAAADRRARELSPPLPGDGPQDPVDRLMFDLALALAHGERAVADSLLERCLAAARSPAEARWLAPTLADLVSVLARGSRPDFAFDVLAEYAALREEPPDYDWLVRSQDLDSLRSDPRFAALFPDARARFEATLAPVRDARAHGKMPPFLGRALDELTASLDRTRPWSVRPRTP